MTLIKFRILVLIGIFVFFQYFCLSNEHSFSRLTIENGLSNNHVNSICKDSYGYIWLGTIDGIDRYDGIEIRSYSHKFKESVENVNSITEDNSKNLWIGTTSGLFQFNRKQDLFNRISIGIDNIDVQVVQLLPDSNLCIGTTNGLYLINTSTLKAEKIPLSDQSISVNGIFPDNYNNCWIATSIGLVRYSFYDGKSEWFQNKLKPMVANNSFSSICNIGNKIYLGTNSVGIVEFDLSGKVFSKGVDIGNTIVLNLTSDNKELIFAGTDGDGLKVINTRTGEIESIVSQENNNESLSSNSIYSFYLDENGRYWLGTFSAGLCFSKNIAGNFKLHPITSKYADVNKSIRSFYFTPDGSQYFGTRNGFVQLSKAGDLKLFKAPTDNKNELRSNIILSVYPFMGDILIGTYGGGISRFSVSQQKMIPFLENRISRRENIYGFDVDSFGDLWITTYNGLYKYSPKNDELINYTTKNSELESDQIFVMKIDSEKRIWVGSMTGTSGYKYNDGKLVQLDLSAISNNTFKTNYIYEDQAGNIWICSERGGLIKINKDLRKSTTFDVASGLPDNSVCSIIEGGNGKYWISTLKGFCNYSNQTGVFTKYSLSEGLPGLVFTPAASFLAADGTLFFGNEKGLMTFNPEELEESSVSSKIIITDFYISGKEVKPGENSVLEKVIEETKEVHLSDGMNNIGFRFAALNFINPADNNYQHMLEGFDNEWKNNGSNNTVFYQNLKAGNYSFKIRDVKDAGNESIDTVALNITIQRTFFKTGLFYLIIIFIAISGTFLLLRYIKSLKKNIKHKIEQSKKQEKYKSSKIPQNRSEIIIELLKKQMEEEKPYLNSELKLADLADEIGHSSNEISQVLNQTLNQSFSDFVNRYRVEEVKKQMCDEAYEKYTLVAIAKQCGFNSKTSFYRIFKNETGRTPADYLKNLKEPKPDNLTS